jgi:PilX N-terminal
MNQPTRNRRSQQGVASLIIVAVLFFIMSLVAAYANRNLIFEQRTSANQYRSTQAFEAAEAGIEWALAMLNAGSISADSCEPSDDPDDTTFRERYLSVNDAGVFTARDPDGTGLGTVWPSCVFADGTWACACPSEGAADLEAEGPAFRIRLSAGAGNQPGLVLIEANGCTRRDDQCLDFPARSLGGEGRATVSVMVALRTALPAVPEAAVTARGTVNITGAGLAIWHEDPGKVGLSVVAGGPASGFNLSLPTGTLPQPFIENDPTLAAIATADRMFTTTFVLTPNMFADQPGLRVLVDCDGGCDADAVRTQAALNRGRPLYFDGDIDFDSDDDIGSPDAPVLIVATGNITFSANPTVYGLLYSRAADWSISGTGRVVGAAVAEGDLTGNATTVVEFDKNVLQALQQRTGSFVRVPGGWADFRGAP